MEDSDDEIFWGPISEREREVVKRSLLRDISECSSRIPKCESSNEDSTSVRCQSLGPEFAVVHDSASISPVKSNTHLENDGIEMSFDSTSNSCGGTFLVSNDCSSESVCSTSKSHDNADVELSFDGIISRENTEEESGRTSSNLVGNNGESLSSSKSYSKEVCNVSLCSKKLAALTTGEDIDAASGSMLLECSSESDGLNDTLEEVESIMKRALELMHCEENSKENFRENKSTELEDHESKALFGPNFNGVPLGMKPGPSVDSTSPVIRSSPKVPVNKNASPRNVVEKNACVKSKKIPQIDGIKHLKLPLRKQNFLSVASPIAQYIKYRPPALLQNVKVKDNFQREIPTSSVVPDENVRRLTPARNKLPIVKYDTAPIVNMNCHRIIEKNTLPKASSITPKVFKHTGRVVLSRSPSRAMSNVVCTEVSVVYEKDVSATNNLQQ